MINEHDLRYKLLFSHKIIVQRLLEGFIDEPFVRRIDFGTLREEKTNTISDDEKERESDAIGSVRVGDTRLYIYILIEFQRTVDPWMPLRFSRYVQRFYDVGRRITPQARACRRFSRCCCTTADTNGPRNEACSRWSTSRSPRSTS